GATMTPTQALIDRLKSAGFSPRATGRGSWESRCPAHDGDRPNLSISTGEDGRALIHCHAHNCKPEDIVAAVGMELKDLFPARNGTPTRPKHRPGSNDKPKAPTRSFESPEGVSAALSADLGKPTGVGIYTDAAGAEVARVLRFDPPG